MKKDSPRKTWLQFRPLVAPFPCRDVGLVVGTLLLTGLISSPAVAVSPAPPPPEFFAAPQTGDALWAVCGGSSSGHIPVACSAYVVGTSDGVAFATGAPARRFCLTAQVQPPELAEVVRLFMATHPQSRSQNAASVVAVALTGAYPCGLAEQRR